MLKFQVDEMTPTFVKASFGDFAKRFGELFGDLEDIDSDDEDVKVIWRIEGLNKEFDVFAQQSGSHALRNMHSASQDVIDSKPKLYRYI